MIDYALLQLIWWFFIFTLFAFFFVFGGRDFGACILLPIIGRQDNERRMIINSIGTTWEGNQVWFITAGGATFAAWPMVYATAFSGLYIALLLVLLSLILRPPGFDFRSKLPSPLWRQSWDYALFISGFVPALVFGVALGNLFVGLPFHLNPQMQSFYEGSFWGLLNPTGLIFGVAAVLILTLQGGLFLQHKLPEPVASRARTSNILMGFLFALLFGILGWWIMKHLQGYTIMQIPEKGTAFLPFAKSVTVEPFAWIQNYHHIPPLWGFPITTFFMIIGALGCAWAGLAGIGLILNSIAIFTALATAGIALFPFILPSSINPNHSLTVWDASSSHLTLNYMFWVAIVFLPIILLYTFWAFRVFRGKIVQKIVIDNNESY